MAGCPSSTAKTLCSSCRRWGSKLGFRYLLLEVDVGTGVGMWGLGLALKGIGAPPALMLAQQSSGCR
jgi:hypothetical protein